jgi:hypothetical protein
VDASIDQPLASSANARNPSRESLELELGMLMPIEDIGVVSSVLQTVAVVVTLGFLAFQIDRARKEIRRQNARDMIRHNNEILLRLAEDPALLDVHIRGQKNYESLTEAERLKWGFWLFTWVTQTEQGYIDLKRNDFSGLDLDGYVEGLALTLRSEGGKAIWPRLRDWFDPAFCSAVERQVAKSGTTQIERITDLAWQPPPPPQASKDVNGGS